MKPGIQKARERYTKWWVGNYCRVSWYGDVPFRLVVGVELYGPPSFVYGDVFLVFEDGTNLHIPEANRNAYIPRKKDIEAITPEQYRQLCSNS